MKKRLIIPIMTELDKSISLAREYGLGFEYNDFYQPSVLDDINKTDDIIKKYKSCSLPEYCTLHGAFLDVIVFSYDKKIREISELRIIQSIDTAIKIGAKAVVFHTNTNPLLKIKTYEDNWLVLNTEFWSRTLTAYPDIDIYIENMFDQSPEMLSLLAEKLCGYKNFGVCFDYAHAVISPAPIKEWVDSLSRYVKHVHINDNDLISDLHLTVSEGKIDWQEFAYYYNSCLSDATLLIEVSTIESQRRSLEVMREMKLI